MQPTKRKRTDGDCNDAIEPLRSNIWFSDGNLIVQAQNTQFRVYKGTLCTSSEVLKGAIENMGDSKGLEGCPLLFLSDSSVDVGYLFEVIFDRWSYPDDEPLPFHVIAAFLRLGRKYDIKPLYAKALARLTAAFPCSVDQYLAGASTRILFSDPTTPNRNTIAIDTIILARELNLTSLLPVAFWCVARDPELLAHKNTRLISEDDRDAMLLAMAPVRCAFSKHLYDWLDETSVASPECTEPTSCRMSKMRYSLWLWKAPGNQLGFHWPARASKDHCKSCVAIGKKHQSEGVKQFWEELPSFFGLPSWEELKAADTN
ncbi:hypothetical protein DFH06DRAFT_282732 [Mycena polygramma]|nr:hypothetical protein DFH06DRAFT_282732 [Mycena polygramma]